jgi:hypothetical protein
VRAVGKNPTEINRAFHFCLSFVCVVNPDVKYRVDRPTEASGDMAV